MNKKSKIKKILVIMGPGIGDVITSLPAIDNLRRSFKDVQIDVMNETLHGFGHNLLKNNKNVNQILRFHRIFSRAGIFSKLRYFFSLVFSRAGIFSNILFSISLIKENYDIVFNCYPSTKKTAIFSFLIGRKIRAGIFENPYSFLFNKKIKANKLNKIDVESELIKKIGGKIYQKKVNLNLNPSSKKVELLIKKNKIKGKFAVFHPGKICFRNWPDQYWKTIADYLISKKINVIFIGAGQDIEPTKKILSKIKRAKDFLGKLDLEEIAYLLKKADVFLGANSGIMHLSATQGINTIALQGTSSYGWDAFGKNAVNIRLSKYECNGPYNSNYCYTYCTPESPKCMQDIPPEKVIKTLKKMLKIKN